MRAFCLLVLTSLWLPAAIADDGFASPESALVVAGDVYVSNLGPRPAPSLADGDGYIARRALDGSAQDLRHLPVEGELNAPKGMAVIGPILYVADIDRIVGFDMESRARVFELSLAETGTRFLNDLVAVGSNLMVSATDIDTIFEVDPARERYRPVMRFVRAPNGLYYDPDRRWLYVAGYGRNGRDGELGLVRLDSRIPTYRRLGLRGRLDGIARIGDWLVITDWGTGKRDGRLHAYHPATERVRRDVLTGLEGPADLAADPRTGRIWLPEMLANRLRVEAVELE